MCHFTLHYGVTEAREVNTLLELHTLALQAHGDPDSWPCLHPALSPIWNHTWGVKPQLQVWSLIHKSWVLTSCSSYRFDWCSGMYASMCWATLSAAHFSCIHSNNHAGVTDHRLASICIWGGRVRSDSSGHWRPTVDVKCDEQTSSWSFVFWSLKPTCWCKI